MELRPMPYCEPIPRLTLFSVASFEHILTTKELV